MTIGEKIKYYRTNAHLTQSQLAAATNIHIVSIKKYETNKMQPQLPQIERIAAALGIGTNALLDITDFTFSCETVADFMGILIMLNNSRLINIKGVRKDDGYLDPDTVYIHLNNSRLFSSLLKLSIGDKEGVTPDQITIQIRNALILRDLVKWEKMNYLYTNAISNQGENPDEATKAAIAELAIIKEKVELEVQRSMVMLDTKNGIRVKMNPIYGLSEKWSQSGVKE